jgi:hypothetical protein
VLLEDRHFLLAEALMELVDPAVEGSGSHPRLVDRVHAELEAARLRIDVLRELRRQLRLGSTRPRWCAKRAAAARRLGCRWRRRLQRGDGRARDAEPDPENQNAEHYR